MPFGKLTDLLGVDTPGETHVTIFSDAVFITVPFQQPTGLVD